MSLQLISHSPDLMKLRNEGYEVSIHGGYLVITNVPYVNRDKRVQRGILVTDLTIGGGRAVKPRSHVVHFAGEQPCRADGSEIQAIKHSSARNTLGGVQVDHSFSNKPQGGYSDYYHKMTQYIRIISNEARALDPSVTAQTFKVMEDVEENGVLKYWDTNASRSHVDSISKKLAGLKVAIIGLGGTGSYILDSVAKTLVAEIHLFDGAPFLQHNAFRAPGAASLEELNECKKKVHYYAGIYSKMHKGIIPHDFYLDETNIHLLDKMDFVFISIDKSEPKRIIFGRLIELETPFIDVGMGVDRVDGALTGMLRLTTCTPNYRKSVQELNRVSFVDPEEDGAYDDNIQIAELNNLNACLAVIKWKKLFGVYHDQEKEHNAIYSINLNSLLNEDSEA